MPATTISSRFRVVIPKEIREALSLQPGDRLQAYAFGGGITLMPVEPMARLCGFLQGLDTSIPRHDR